MDNFVIKCHCSGHLVDVETWTDPDDEYEMYIMLLYEYANWGNDSLWQKIKTAFNILRGRKCLSGDVVLDGEEMTKFINELKKVQTFEKQRIKKFKRSKK